MALRQRYREDEQFRVHRLRDQRERRAGYALLPGYLEALRAYMRKRYHDNPSLYQARSVMYEKKTAMATPPWLTSEQKGEILGHYEYATFLSEATSIPHEVDHIVPLRGKNVCGLNVPWNLRILTREENRRKSSKMPDPEELLGHTTRSIYYVPVEMGQHG